MKFNIETIANDGAMIYKKNKKKGEIEYSNYVICFNRTNKSGEVEKKYMRVFFNKGVSVANQTIINVKRAFIGFDNKDWFLHISEFETLKTGCDQVINGEKPKDLKDELKFL